jgi:putative flippase GtrA
MKKRIETMLRSLGVGGLGSLVDFVVLTLLATVVGLGPRVASPFALLAGMTVQFFGQKLFAFRDRRPAWGSQLALFGLVEIAGFALNLVLFDLAVRALPSVPYLGLRVVVQLGVYLGVCLPLWSRIFAGGVSRRREGLVAPAAGLLEERRSADAVRA